MNTLQILKDARKLIEKEENWCQGDYYENNKAQYSFCSIGACNYICTQRPATLSIDSDCPEDDEDKYNAWCVIQWLNNFSRHHHGCDIDTFNDNHTHVEVLALFDKAIASLEVIDFQAMAEELSKQAPIPEENTMKSVQNNLEKFVRSA